MSAGRRLLGFALLTLLFAGTALWVTREALRRRESPQEIGLRWLRDEYHLDDATYQRIEELHRNYAVQFQQLCRELDDADRPLLLRRQPARPGSPSWSSVGSQVKRERVICGNCEQAAVTHLRQVAELMPPAEGERFLEEMLPALRLQRIAHDRKISAAARK